MAVRMNQEPGGFKLLEEDALDDRPCAAVKKFVSSVLDRKDMKDQEVANSFRNLMEYRDSTSSPSACSVATSTSALDGDRLNSPPSPSSPSTAPGPMDDQRLPNELLDEICEDIGMKEGMELDFVEYLMEQDSNPHIYMTQEAISSGAFNSAAGSTISTPTGSASGGSNSGSGSSSHASNNNEGNKTLTVLNPPATTTPNFLFKPNFNDSDWLNQFPSPLIHSSSGQSSGSTTIQSSENNSPSNKRIHLSVSTDTSPNKGRSQTPPGFNQANYGNQMNNQHMFKMPPPGPLTKRSHSFPQGAPASSPVQSTHSSSSQGSNTSSNGHNAFSRPQEFSMNPPCHPSDSSDQEDNLTNKKVPCISPKPVMPTSSATCDFIKPGSPACVQGQYTSMPGSVGRDGGVFQRVGKQPPPNVNVKTMQPHQPPHQQPHQPPPQHQRWAGPPQKPHNVQYFNKGVYPGGAFPPHHPHHQTMGHVHMGHMAGPPGPHNPPVRTPVDSPLDQGYFSNESAGNCSNGSAPSPAFTTSSISSFSSISTMMPADQSQSFSQKASVMQQQQPQQSSGMSSSRPQVQKSVHFADMPEGSPPAYSQNNNTMDVKPNFGPGQAADCFDMENNGQPKGMQSMKILPRINHSMKSGVAPYTVPNSQMMVPSPYDFSNRPSCAMSGDPASPDSMQEFMSKSSQINGSNNSFYVDGNQNMMRIDSMQDYPPQSVPPLMPPQQSGDFGVMPQGQPRYMEQFPPMQQPSHPAQSSHSQHVPPSSSSSSDSAPPPHPQMQQQQQPAHHYSSCSHSGQGMGPEYGPPHINNMQISNSNSGHFQMPLAMSTPMSNRGVSNNRGSYGPQMGPPSYENSFGGHPDMYQTSQGPQHPGQGMMPNQQPSVHRGWGPGMSGPPGMHGTDELQVQVGGMHNVPGPMKGSLQPPHPHMQPSPTPGCAAPGSHIQDLSIINSSVHMGPPHPHMGPHPDYGPCMGMNCNTCKMAQAGSPPHLPQHMGPCQGPNCPSCKMNHQGPPSAPHGGPCAGPNCTACKMQQANRPQMLSSQHKFIQHLIMDEGNSAYRSHPLFPLLRDLVIAEMNFDNPRFHYQQLLSLLPNDFHKLLQNFLHRNPPSGHYQTNQAVESVIMDSLRLAHSNLVDKIRHRQELEKMKANSSASLRSMEEFCQKFDHSVNGPMARPVPNGVNTMGMGHPMASYHDGGYMQPGMSHMGQYRTMKEGQDMLGDPTLSAASPQANKTESKKHPSLPKEAVAMMMEWLRSHKDNPYPNDDEKAMLIKQTGLSINQINYWFTNARRRILPKWAQCKT
ncbi:trithorax group protein osa-like [Physella acuta]|uniref:trithorax group protein osa-like n=1 Tax=Physella acuta TaxID=109671 RepID=UPI0027DB639E|nr:trithorax group protein osa-like [Physella acuta]